MPTDNLEAALAVIDAADGNVSAAALDFYNGPKSLALYMLEIAVTHLKARKRATNRRSLRRVVQPEFKKSGVTGRIVLTQRAKKRLTENTRSLFGKDGWDIGEINIGAFTREDLLAQAAKERASAKGHIRNAQFYEALAEPMKPGEVVRDHWKNPSKVTAVKDKIWRDTEGQQPTLY
jgi:hypothetical protein